MAFRLDLTETFPHLSNAPIVEAQIRWQARPAVPWTPSVIHEALKRELPEYTRREPVQQFGIHFQAALGSGVTAAAESQDSWQGVRLETEDRLQVAVFSRDGLAVSRLKPYPDWGRFADEAMRLWRVFVGMAKTEEVRRLGVRFINRMPAGSVENVADYLHDPPSRPAELPIGSFLYKSTYDVPDKPLSIHVVKTWQPGRPGQSGGTGLIVDIEVFTKEPFTSDDQHLIDRLHEMRWLKNKVFFGLFRADAIKQFQE